MKNMKIKTKILVGFLAVILLATVIGVVSMVMTNTIAGHAEEIFEMHVKGLEALMDATGANARMRVYLNRMAFYAAQADPATLNSERQLFNDAIVDFEAALGEYSKTVVTEAGWEEFNRMGALKEVYEGALAVFYGVIDVEVNNADYSQRGPRVTAAIAPMSDAAGPITGWLDNMQAQKEVAASEANDAANRVAQVSTVIEVILVVIVILLSLFIAFYISGGIEKTLNEIINKLSASSGTINASAIQLSEASDNLASGSSRQAAAIEETSATMNETSSMVEQNAENTRVAAQLALDATNMANKGMTEMKDMSRAMEEMKDSSDKVGRIIKTIDDIAFQTNLLAINATVEAARAGEAGRSFGVVAQAVRDLAQQSADAAANTAEIIDGNISLTNSGREISREVSLSLEQITDKTSQLNKLIAEINAASEEQASGIKQINVAVTQMETVTQENAAVAEETSAASHSMQDEIGNLEDAVRIAERLVKIR